MRRPNHLKTQFLFDLLDYQYISEEKGNLSLIYCQVERLFRGQKPAVFVVNEDAFFNGKFDLSMKRKYSFKDNQGFQAYRFSVNKNFVKGLEHTIYSASILKEFDSLPPPSLSNVEFEAGYLLHHKMNHERLAEMKDQLYEAGFVWIYLIHQYDFRDLSPTELDCWFSKEGKSYYLKHDEEVISSYVKHYFAYFHLSKSSHRSAIILEENSRFLKNTAQYRAYEQVLPKSYDFFFPGICAGHLSDSVAEKIHVSKEKTSRCTHAYYVSKSGALSMLENFQTLCSIDHHINQIQSPLEIYWGEPAYIMQTNNISIQHPDICLK